MQRRGFRSLLAALGACALALPASSQPPMARASERLARALQGALPPEGLAISVVLREDTSIRSPAQRRARLRDEQQRVLDSLPADFRLGHRYQTLAGLSGRAGRGAIRALLRHPDVERVDVARRFNADLIEGGALIGAPSLHAQGFTGMGVRVAVLDSGIDGGHTQLSDDLFAEHCFCDDNPSPNKGCCPGGDDEEDGPGSAQDDEGHGTAVSGIITSSSGLAPGVAPDAEIVAVKVLDGSGGGWDPDIAAGLDWVLANLGTLGVQVVNMSLSDGLQHNNPNGAGCQGDLITNAVENLHAAGVAVFASAGNQGYDNGIASPACNADAISVGGVYDASLGSASWCADSSCNTILCTDNPTAADTFVCHSNSDEILDVLFPDWKTRTTALGGGTLNFGGTSASSPYAAASAALLLEADPSLTPEQIRTLLTSHGPMVTNPDNGLSFRRTDLAAALAELIGDTDGDGILDDGDASGTAGDAPCTGGATTSCDDNCPTLANADQADPDADGVGDVCDVCSAAPDPQQIDSNLDGYGNACDADYTNDEMVGIPDFSVFSSSFGLSLGETGYDPDADHNGDDGIGLPDFAVFSGQFNGPPGPSGLACAGTIPCTVP